MEKSRVLNSITFNGDKTGYYRASTSTGLYPEPSDDDVCAKFGISANRYATLAVAVNGSESFRSTEYKRPKVNECRHVKTNEVAVNFFSLWHQRSSTASGVYFGRPHYSSNWYPYYVSAPGKNLWYYADPTPALVDVSSASRRAWWNMQPHFHGNTQLLNSLFELRDFRECGRNLLNSINRLRRFGPALTRPPARENPLDDASHTLAEGTLFFNLAVRPLLRDIAALLLQAQTLASEAEAHYIENGQQPHTVHYSEELFYSSTLPTPLNGDVYVVVGKQSRVLFTASMERTYSVRPRGSYQRFLDYWGLNLDFEAMWNALPFSFLADYVLSIGKAIHAMETDPYTDPLQLTYYESVLRESTRGNHTSTKYHGKCTMDGSRIFDPQSTHNLTGGCRNSYYERYFAAPNFGPALPAFNNLTRTQLTNIVALLRVFT